MDDQEAVTNRINSQQLIIKKAFKDFCKNPAQQQILELDEIKSLLPQESINFFYKNDEFDWVACYELIEHLDSFNKQALLLAELLRIARKGIFLSTVNRRHPIDMQTGVPFLHWMRSHPERNLLDAEKIKRIISDLPVQPDWKLGHVRFLGIKSHYFLMIKK